MTERQRLIPALLSAFGRAPPASQGEIRRGWFSLIDPAATAR